MENKKFNFVLVQYSRETVEFSEGINAYALEDFGCDGIEEFALEEARVDEILGERAYSGGDVPESLIDEVQAATIDQDSFTYKYFFYQNDFEKNASEFVFFLKKITRNSHCLLHRKISKTGMQNGKSFIHRLLFQIVWR